MIQPKTFCIATFLLMSWLAGGSLIAQDQIEKADEAEQNRIAAINRASAASICVFSADGKGGGSGVIVSNDGFALTNFHVVEPCGTYMHCGMSDGSIYDAVVVGTDPTGDVAMIKLIGRNDFPVVELADSDLVRIGDSCFAVGNPFLLATNFEPSVSWGVVSGTHRYQYPSKSILEYTDCIQTDAAINPGNSGGPLFDASGRLIGINGRGSFEKRGRINVGVGYAISINQIKIFWEHLKSGRVVDHASLGATVQTSNDGRVLVDQILESSDAYRRGLRYGDEIVEFAGRSIETVNEFKNVLGIYPKGWRVPLSFRRGDLDFQVHVRLEALHSPEELMQPASKERKQPGQKPKAIEIPKAASELIEARTGYANYYFNRLHRDQVWKESRGAGDFSRQNKNWLIEGTLTNGNQTAIRITLDNETSAIQWGEATAFLKETDLASQRIPEGSGGLLPTLHLWRSMLVQNPANLGESFYLGSLPNRDGTFSRVIQTRYEGTQSNFHFNWDSGFLDGIETWTDEALDSCEIRFSDFREVDGVMMPFEWEARCGDDFLWSVAISDVRFVASDNEKKEDNK